MRNLFILTLVLALLSLILAIGAYLRISNLGEELSQMRIENEKLSSSVEELKKRPTIGVPGVPLRSKMITIDEQTDYAKGDKNAPITLIEYCDYQSLFCRHFHNEVLPKLDNDYISAGKVRYIYRNFPRETHGMAIPAANAVRCAGEQGKYWEFQEFVFTNPENLNMDKIIAYAEDSGLELGDFKKCVSEKTYESQILGEKKAGVENGIGTVPSLLIGKTRNDNKLQAANVIGARNYNNLRNHVEELLNEEKNNAN
ncbi:MAG TPA: thioredoxin domain-containing protein [Thermodesulfobacteriota bacterium]